MDCERASGLALTGHDDNYDWIELMGQSPSGEIVPRAFVQIGEHKGISEHGLSGESDPVQGIDTGGNATKDSVDGADVSDMGFGNSDADARYGHGEEAD